MALLQTLEKITHDHVLFRCKTVAAKGSVLSYAIGDAGKVEKIVGLPVPTTKAAGLLLQDVENRSVPLNLAVIGDDTGTVDLPRNFNRNVTNVSGVCRLLVHGFVETDQYSTLGAPTPEYGQGSGLYLGPDGLLTSVATSGFEKVGHCLSGIRNSMIRVFINIT